MAAIQVLNFSAGPAVIPCEVRRRVAEYIADPGEGRVSVLEVSHRSDQYESIHSRAISRCRRLYSLPEDMEILFVQGGASLQFAMVPQNLIRPGRSADYLVTGSWSERALSEVAALQLSHRIAGSSADRDYTYIPEPSGLVIDGDAEYLHITTNNTICGTQYRHLPDAGGVPIVADISSDMLSRPLSWEDVGLAYGGAQKNAGIAGLTLVLAKSDLLRRKDVSALPKMMRYTTYAESNSLYNTPPVFAIFVFDLILQWIEEQGGLAGVQSLNQRKADVIYSCLDDLSPFFQGHAEVDSRSLMNITFKTADATVDVRFCTEAAEAGMAGLAGHRSVGGVRASVYNAMPLAGCEALAQFMRDFAAKNG